MLSTQVEYWKLQENARHNLETEAQGWFSAHEAQRHNVVSEKETQRHNVETEGIGWFGAQETQRHNLASEDISRFSAFENQRHNLVSEGLGYDNLAETTRHNKASERISATSANASMLSAQAAQTNAVTRGWEYDLAQQRAIWEHQEHLTSLDIDQQRADIAQQQADTQFRQVDESIVQGYLGINQSAYANIINAQRLEHQVGLDWANYGLNAARWTSQEARGWVNALTDLGG